MVLSSIGRSGFGVDPVERLAHARLPGAAGQVVRVEVGLRVEGEQAAGANVDDHRRRPPRAGRIARSMACSSSTSTERRRSRPGIGSRRAGGRPGARPRAPSGSARARRPRASPSRADRAGTTPTRARSRSPRPCLPPRSRAGCRAAARPAGGSRIPWGGTSRASRRRSRRRTRACARRGSCTGRSGRARRRRRRPPARRGAASARPRCRATRPRAPGWACASRGTCRRRWRRPRGCGPRRCAALRG